MLSRVKDLSPDQDMLRKCYLVTPCAKTSGQYQKPRRDNYSVSALARGTDCALRALDERFASRPVPKVSVEEEEALVRETFRSTRPDHRPVS